jgi:methyl-accepting chemotaxis protein
VKSLGPAQFLPVLKRVQSQNKDYEYLYVADKNGNGIGTNDVPVNVADRDYFPKVMQGQTVISDPIVSKATGNRVIAVVAPVYKDGDNKPDGLVGVTLTLDYLQELVKNMKLSGQGYGFIQTANMITIAHPNREYLGNNKMLNDADARLKELLQKMSRGEKGYGHYTFGGVDKMLAYAPVEVSGWAVAQTANISDVMAPLAVMRGASLAVTLVALLVMVGVAFVIAGYISGPVIKLSRAAEAVARGDLAHGMDQVTYTGRDEIGTLAGAFKQMVDNLKEMIAGIQKNFNQLAAQSQELAASSEEVSATIEEVASTTS